MEEKGFTLIELLAVIVILAIIALIATPIVLNIIEDSKKSAFVQTGNGIIDAAEYYYMNEMSDGVKPTENKVFTFDGSTTSIEGLEFDGEIPKEGTLTVNTEGKVQLVAHNNRYCIIKVFSDNEVVIKDYDGSCEPPKEMYTNGIMTSENSCIKTGNCEAGTPVSVKVNNDKTYNFYVLSSTATDITLIMDQKINSDGSLGGKTEVTKESNQSQYNQVEWISKSDYNDDESYGEYGKNDKGPVTVMKFLYNATKDWTNVPPLNYAYNDKEFHEINCPIEGWNKGYGYTSFELINGILKITSDTEPVVITEIGTAEEPLRARVIQIAYYDGIKKGEILSFGNLFKYDYWTLSSMPEEISTANAMYKTYGEGQYVSSARGVIPVITLEI